MKVEPGTLALAVAASSNDKIGESATTYAAQSSCPTACVFKDGGGCYAEEGMLGMTITGPLNKAAAFWANATPEEIAEAEANAIDRLTVNRGYPLRLHTVGDCSTIAAAQIVAAAAFRYMQRGGGPVWTYTHAWRDVPRTAWGNVNVLASCETPLQVEEAMERGYATALVVESFPGRARYTTTDEVDEAAFAEVIPCPAQTTHGVTCASCRLCMNSERLFEEDLTIGFAIHGTPLLVRRARMALEDPENPDRKLSSRVLIPRAIERMTPLLGREPTTAELARELDMTYGSIWEMRRSLAGEAPRPKRPSRRKEKMEA